MASEETEKFDPTLVADEELRETFSGPAPLANRLLLTRTASGVRLAFLEMNFPKVSPQFRAAVLLSYQDALALRDLLATQLKDVEQQLKDAEDLAKKAAGVPPSNG